VRLFFDANTLFTGAHNPNGKAAFIIQLGTEGHWNLFTSVYAIAEASRNLEAKFPSATRRLAEQLEAFTTARDDPSIECPASLPAKDQPIYRAARKAGATHLLTGDIRDFGPLMNLPDLTDGMVIQTVAQFLEAIQHDRQT